MGVVVVVVSLEVPNTLKVRFRLLIHVGCSNHATVKSLKGGLNYKTVSTFQLKSSFLQHLVIL